MTQNKENNKIEFLLNHKLVTIFPVNFRPGITVLNYLREHHFLKGTKEGCAQGDCGACTVVLSEIDAKGGLSYKAVNSCLLLLPMLHGKHLITVEGLAQKDGAKTILHPVQLALLHKDGAQCGFCTPGMVMSLFASWQNGNLSDRAQIVESLSGNLCRCTGYQSIIDAAEELNSISQNQNESKNETQEDFFSKNEDFVFSELKRIANRKDSLKIESKNQTYFRPNNLPEALFLRMQFPEAVIVNGASDFVVDALRHDGNHNSILDISALPELDLFVEDHSCFLFGAGFHIEDLFRFSQLRLPAFANVLRYFGSRQVRNVATIGGSLASGSPIGDLAPFLMITDTEITLKNLENNRVISISEFFSQPRNKRIKSDELLAFIKIPKPKKNLHFFNHKLSKRDEMDISTLSMAASLELVDKKIKGVKIAFGGMAATPKFATNCALFLEGKQFSEEIFQQAGEKISEDFTPISDVRGSAEYRILAAKQLLMKWFTELLETLK